MVSKTSRSIALGLGIVSTLALATVPAKAQIQVTGGTVSGNAAYFIPELATQGIRPFDLQVQSLTIVSPNGTLTNPAFVPTALGGYTDTDGGNTVTSGDTGLIRGRLSGIGFDSNGFIIPFSQVDTILGYQVGSFASDTSIVGSLLSAGSSQYFLSNLYGNVGDVLIPGKMEVGALNGDLKTGLIALPSTIQFSGSSGGSLIPGTLELASKVKFEFKGNNAQVAANTTENDLNGADGEIKFLGEADSFKIETIGGGDLKVKLSGTDGVVDFNLTNGTTVGSVTDGTGFVATDTVDYKIKGQGTGIFGFLSDVGANFAGTNATSSGGQPVEYDFTQANGFESKGKLRGDIAIALAVGQTFDSSITSVSSFSAAQSQILSAANIASTNNTVTQINTVNNLNIGGFSFKFSGGKIDLSNIFNADGTTTAAASQTTAEQDFFKALVNSVLDELKLSGSITSFSTDLNAGTYELLGAPLYSFAFTSPGRSGKVKIRLVQRGGDRYVIALRGGGRGRRGRGLGVAVGGFKFVGPTSRIFPTLVGTADLTPEQIQS
ncbi:hypothetical protein, partial [Spirulina sp. 06S082]|uniref:hypothetical protein n=1 Tax=Spirulina sp. 06S082 TaxID=3110248 RepID=UPI002B1F0571